MNGPNLYQINEHLQAILDAAMDNDGELTPELEEQLAINEAEFETKAEGYCHAIRIYEAQAAMFKAEQDRIAAGRKRIDAQVERLKSRLSDAVMMRGGAVDIGTFSLSHRKSESVIIDNENALPSELREIVETIKPDKTAIKERIKAGEVVPGASLVVNQNLQIK